MTPCARTDSTSEACSAGSKKVRGLRPAWMLLSGRVGCCCIAGSPERDPAPSGAVPDGIKQLWAPGAKPVHSKIEVLRQSEMRALPDLVTFEAERAHARRFLVGFLRRNAAFPGICEARFIGEERRYRQVTRRAESAIAIAQCLRVGYHQT